MSLHLEMEVERSTLIVRLDGELDHHTSEMVREKIEAELDKGIVKNLIFNLEQLSFMDSSGLGMMLGRYKRVVQQNGKMSICCLQANVYKIFELSGMFKILPVYDNESEAIKSLEVA
ncbi:anti-sigma F factor antagonist [Tepidibacillus infernus]|uniref:Anti-sigma F factor antagonist n=1 Tax=Tepidibacillus decaturensis TaxID=1413211 RepID=A0A135L2Y5_9BACI|nr:MULTISPECIES: anti-sigma F factor antagonist [Tepidibacillus]KXG43346.1 anti-sigma F factor antagonist [Tepidibacillus decaturensis]GBF11558.1 anti-sigma F factor antagonist [Tepidibacillus sp. HK-1]